MPVDVAAAAEAPAAPKRLNSAWMEIAARNALVAARKRRGMTQADVAEILEHSRETIARWERELSDPSLGDFFRWAAAVGVEISAAVVVTAPVTKEQAP